MLAISKAGSSYKSLGDDIRNMIREDRGYSIAASSNSGGIPSPIRESDTFKKMYEFKDTDKSSTFDQNKIKKIEFSDSMSKEGAKKSQKKPNEIKKKDCPFSYSSVDKIVFGNA